MPTRFSRTANLLSIVKKDTNSKHSCTIIYQTPSQSTASFSSSSSIKIGWTAATAGLQYMWQYQSSQSSSLSESCAAAVFALLVTPFVTECSEGCDARA